jgi:haloalkane dehalogenase
VEILRTPDARFTALDSDGLDGFRYEPRYVEVPAGDDGGGTLRIGYVEDGPADGPVVLLLHGEPTWSYLYRSMLPVLAARGLRAVALDLVGFGRSDKPARTEDHSYARHVEWVRAAVLDALGLTDITLVCQDWGGLIGLRLATENPDRFTAIVAANTGLPTGDQPMPDIWWAFRTAVETAPTLDVGRLVASGCKRGLSDIARAAYDAPFPDESYKAGPRAMPLILPTAPDDPATEPNRLAWRRLTSWNKPFLVAFSDSDPITGAMAPVLTRAVPSAAGREQPVVANAGHFLQEDAGEELAVTVADFIAREMPN